MPMLQTESMRSKRNFLLLEVSLLFYVSLQLMKPTDLDSQSVLLSSPIKMTISFKNMLIDTARIIFEQISGHPSGPTKLTHSPSQSP